MRPPTEPTGVVPSQVSGPPSSEPVARDTACAHVRDGTAVVSALLESRPVRVYAGPGLLPDLSAFRSHAVCETCLRATLDAWCAAAKP